MKTQIKQMLQLQQKLNDNTNGTNWTDGITKNGKKIDWNRCIYMETIELMDSFPWKHWKNVNQKVDIDNTKIELVDIWHFLLSKLLEESFKKDTKIEELIDNIFKHISYNGVKSDMNEIFKHCEKLIGFTINKNSCDILLNEFFYLCSMLSLNFDELYKIYLGKNVLNIFRQKNGYKSGNYIKIWNGVEDNIVMKEFLNNSNLNYTSLYNALSCEYLKIKSKHI